MASGNMKIIKRRIKSVRSTMQITKAMELVASSKLRRAKQKSKNARPYFDSQIQLLREISRSHNIESPFTAKRERKNSLYIVVAGDRGLAGGYNSNIFKLTAAEIAKSADGESAPKIIAVGKKAVEYYEKRGFEIVSRHTGLAENVKSGHCSDIANTAINLFLSKEVDEVKLFYTRFASSLSQVATVMPLLPLLPELLVDDGESAESEAEIAKEKTTGFEYDPSPEAVFNRIVPCFMTGILQCAIIESYTSEQSARRVAMESASDNAEEMIENLSLLYNRARQEKITNEINEIVGGANAL